LLVPLVEATAEWRGDETQITADAGYHSRANLDALEAQGVSAYVADPDYRQRDARYADQAVHQDKPEPLWDKRPQEGKPFTNRYFQIDTVQRTCVCPAGKTLYANGANCQIGGKLMMKFQGAKQDCGPCLLRQQCLHKPDTTPARQVAVKVGDLPHPENALDRMRHRIDSDRGKRLIGRRFATVEPVFGNLRGNKRLDRFTLRGQTKVDGQWKLYCLVHNIEKLAHHGYAG
jgi:hypothetical protein